MQDAALPDAIIEKHKVQVEYDWMVRNFTVQEEVPELHHENSYASRLYAYMGQKNQVEWLVERLKSNPAARSATITMFEPLTDEGYIPCVSLLDFQKTDGKLDMTAYPLSCGNLSGLEVCDENRHGTAECCHEGG